MKLSTKARYGLRVMLDVAKHGELGPVPTRDIAQRQDISMKYIEKILRELKGAGYLDSKLGVQGGYRLSRGASEISVGDVVISMEGGIDLADCWLKGDNCPRQADCLACTLWEKLTLMITETLNKTKLSDLLVDGAKVSSAGMEFRDWY